jgi:hypothetical protein
MNVSRGAGLQRFPLLRRARHRATAAASAAIAVLLGAVPAGALFTPFTYNAFSHYGGCGNAIDPIESINSLALFPDTSGRGYDSIRSIDVGGSNAFLASTPAVGEESFTVTLCGPIPVFPNATTGGADAGLQLRTCVDPNSVIASAPEYVRTNGDASPVYEGPFPPSQGYRYCTFVNISGGTGGNAVSWGTGVWDPAGGLIDVRDSSRLRDLHGVATISRPSANIGSVATGFAGATQITYYLPDSVITAAYTSSVDFGDWLWVEPFIRGGSSVADWSVTVGLSGYATQGSESPYAITDSGPGVQFCNGPGGCDADWGYSYDYGLVPDPIPVDPGGGVWDCLLGWNYFPDLSANSWPSGIRGQGGWPSSCTNTAATAGSALPGQSQDKGHNCVYLGQCANPGPAVPLSSTYSSTYGREPNPVVTGPHHLHAQYNYGTGNSYGPSA